MFDFTCSKAVDRKRASLLKMKSYRGISESPSLHIESGIYPERLSMTVSGIKQKYDSS